MAKNLLAVSEALDLAADVNNGIDALISLLFSAKQSDVPSGRAIGELLNCLHNDMARHLADAQSGLSDSK